MGGSIRACLGDGSKTIFYHFLQHAVSGHPLLLVLDGHSSHYDPEMIRFAKEHGSLPSHTTHEAQTLDVSFFWPSKETLGGGMSQVLPGGTRKSNNEVQVCGVVFEGLAKTNCTRNSLFRTFGIVPFSRKALMKLVPENDGSSHDDSAQLRTGRVNF